MDYESSAQANESLLFNHKQFFTPDLKELFVSKVLQFSISQSFTV